MELNIENSQDFIEVEIKGKVTQKNSPQLKKALSACFRETKKVILDLKYVTFIDSSGIGTLVYLKKMIQKMGGSLALVSLSPEASVVFQVTRAFEIFDIYDNEKSAKEEIEFMEAK